MKTISRKDAKAAGLKYYFTGKPCKRGHIDQRFVCSFWCKSCGREKASESYRSLNADERKAIYRRKKDYLNRWKESNRERVLGLNKSYRNVRKLTHPEYFKQHYAKNREKRKSQASEWYHANTEKALQARREYVAANRDKARVWGRRSANTRRAVTKQVFVEVVDARTVFSRDKGVCGICKEAVEMTSRWEVDHIVPISKGGLHCYANVQLAHRKCNRSKGAKCA
jgi:5-methylcytosine-specific restriction endonuclease McrA